MTARRFRISLGLILLFISLALFIWGFWPSVRERHILPIGPSDMSLPTPSSFLPGLGPVA